LVRDVSDSATIIATVLKNQREEIRIALDTFKGLELLDIRSSLSTTTASVPRRRRGISVRYRENTGAARRSEHGRS